MHIRHIFPGQDKAVPSFGEAVEEWKPPDEIYTIDNTITTILRYLLGFFSFPFFYSSLFPPLFLSSLIRVLFSLLSFFSLIFSHHHKTQECNLHPHTTNTVHVRASSH